MVGLHHLLQPVRTPRAKADNHRQNSRRPERTADHAQFRHGLSPFLAFLGKVQGVGISLFLIDARDRFIIAGAT
jgi:hypothetical protein